LFPISEFVADHDIERRGPQPGLDSNPASDTSSKESSAPPCQKRRGRKRKAPLSQAEEEVKRGKFLNRNRIAASKCRQKKKGWTHDLEEKKFKLSRENTALKGELEKLASELSSLKAALFLHSDCDYPAFQIWQGDQARHAASSGRDAQCAKTRGKDKGQKLVQKINV
jgi:bZIP transcription factor